MVAECVIRQRLDRLNLGYDFFNVEKPRKLKHYIDITLEVYQNLKKTDETLYVRTDLPFKRGYWNYEFKDFIKDLTEFVTNPLAVISENNRKTSLGYRGLRELENGIRQKTYSSENVNIVVGKLAKEKIKKEFGFDVEKEIKRLLDKQETIIHKEIQEKVDRYIYLREKTAILEKAVGKDNDYSYVYRRNEETDNTYKLTPTDEEYNKQLKLIEKEIRQIEHYLKIEEIEFNYKKIKKEVSFDKWLETNEEELRDSFDEEESGMTFDEYAEMIYEESDKTLDD